MTAVSDIDTQHVLDDLVQQFADPFAFFRELIQNAIDAGSLEVDVAFDWNGGTSPEEPGQLTIHIEDFGEGMNREIIEGKLTRLFSSGKDDDFTKIGKFGIGFVSVFAIQPDAVCVDTGRGGETWRVLFGPDRSWSLIELDYPIEGTQIRVFKTLENEAAMKAFVARSRSVIRQWCRHVEVPIRINGDDIREPFAVPGAIVSTRYDEEGTRLVAGVVDQPVAPFGFYNRGLLLQEGSDSRFPFIGFKIDSRYLEHTLTRDQVVRDNHFEKAMELVRKVITNDLPAAIAEGLVQHAANGRDDPFERHLQAALSIMLDLPDDRPIVPLLGGGAVTLKAARKAAKRDNLFIASSPDDLTVALARRDEALIVHGAPEDRLFGLLDRHKIKPIPHGENHSLVMTVDHEDLPGADQLLAEVERLVRCLGAQPTWIGFGAIGPLPILRQPLICVDDRTKVIDHDDHDFSTMKVLRKAREVVIDVNEPFTAAGLALASTEPEFAAYQMVKGTVLSGGLDPVDDTGLIQTAITARKARRGAS